MLAGQGEARGVTASAVATRGLSKSYGATKALRDVSLSLSRGSLHALVGENGSGKSTFMRVVAGLYRPSGGQVEVGDGHRRGAAVGLLAQRCSLAPELTVLENFALAAPARLLVRRETLASEVERSVAGLGAGVPVDTRADALDTGVARGVEAARLLWSGKRVILLDEPTANLGKERTARLFDAMRKVGATVLFSTHKVGEALSMSDEVHVLRKGKHVLTGKSSGMQEGELLEAMFGEGEAENGYAPVSAAAPSGPPALELRGLTAPGLGPVDLAVMPGGAVGVTGLSGNGQEELLRALSGRSPILAGNALVRGRPRGGAPLREWGLSVIPSDCSGALAVGDMCVDENLVLHGHAEAPFAKPVTGLLDWPAIKRHGDGVVAAERLSVADGGHLFDWLSGGNQRKLLLARELDPAPAVLVAHDIEAGLDHRAAMALAAKLSGLREKGMAMVVISEDEQFLAKVSDRTLRIAGGTIRSGTAC